MWWRTTDTLHRLDMAKESPQSAPHPGSRGFRRLGRALRPSKRFFSMPLSRSKQDRGTPQAKARVAPFRARVSSPKSKHPQAGTQGPKFGLQTVDFRPVSKSVGRGGKREPIFVLS